MANSYFQFKQFIIEQDKCAMKVGTDGVLLGAWTDVSDTNNILDIGTGTGLISLMLAQRSQPNTPIDAIDIDQGAFYQASENIERSIFKDKINCKLYALQGYVDVTLNKYDLIVSNPPYFSQSLLSPNKQRTLARHTDSLSINDLLVYSAKLLSPKGRLSVIYPHSEKDKCIDVALKQSLFVSKITNVYPRKDNSQPKRVLLEFSTINSNITETDITIETERHVYSSEFKLLVKDFYLNL